MMAAIPRRTSIIVAARDAERTLGETLDSLIAQTDPDWEALVVDDGSTDATAAIIADYAARDARIAALSSIGLGVSAARNLGLARARGERLLFLDSDDWIEGHFLERMNAAMNDRGDVVAAYCGSRRAMPDGRLTPATSDPRVAASPFAMFARGCAARINAVLVEREAVEATGGFDPSLRTCEDWDLWQRIARSGRPWAHVDEALSIYRASEGSLTQNIAQMLADARIVIDRGFPGPDDAPERGGAAEAYAYFALWCGALDCGRGGNGEIALDRLGQHPLATEAIVEVLFDGLTTGARVHPDELAARWPGYGDRLTRFVAAIGERLGDAGMARRVQYGLERAILDHDDLAEPRPLALTLGIRIDLADPAEVRPPAGVDRLYLYLCDGERILALVDLGVLGPLDAGYWPSLLVDVLGVSRVGAPQSPAARRHLTRHRRRRIPFASRLLEAPCGHRRRLRQLRKGLHPIWPAQPRWADEQGERPDHVPTLMYRHIAGDAVGSFRAQMRWLHERGFRAIHSGRLVDLLDTGKAFAGRPVLIGFDGDVREFADHAWPILREHGFSAELFVAAGLAPSVDPIAIGRLAREGVVSGVHFGAGQPYDASPSPMLTEQILRSRASLQQWTGQPVTSFIAPAGPGRQRLRNLAAECGFRAGFGMTGRAAAPGDDPLDLPHIEVRGDWPLDLFASNIEGLQ